MGNIKVLISIIIPTYNSSTCIIDALISVANQTYKKFEIIVIDDGSTDNTEEVVRAFQFPIFYLKVPNGGAAKARNLGIERARGDFVAFLDADDLWYPKKLEKQIKAFVENPDLMMVFTENLYFDKIAIRSSPFSKKKRLMEGDIVKNIFLHSYVVTSTVMIRKSVFNTVGYFEESLNVAEDDNLWLRIALKCKIDLIDESLVCYRITENSLSKTEKYVFKGVKKHLELIDHKYINIKKRLGWYVIRKKKAILYFSHGYALFTSNQNGLAREYFLKAFICFPNIKQPIYYFSSFLNESTIDRLKKIKKRMLSIRL